MSTKKSFELTADEHSAAEDLLAELQDRVADLKTRDNGELKSTERLSSYEPLTHTIKIGDDKIVVKERASELKVEHGKNLVVSITGLNLDEIDIDGLDATLQIMRQYMILDDLANI